MDPSMMGGAPPQDPAAGGPLTPEMLDELLGVIEEIAQRQEQQDQAGQQLQQAIEECMAKCEEIEQRLAQMDMESQVQAQQPAMGGGYQM